MNKAPFLFVFLVCLLSCKKDEDAQFPQVDILLPNALSVHQVLQPVSFKVSASDETNLESITVYLLDESLRNAATPVSIQCDENSMIFEGFLLPDDIHLASGIYFIKAVASDGTNEKVVYREIYLNEVPLTLKKTILLTRPSASSIQLDSLNGTLLQSFYTHNSDFSSFSIDSWNQSLVFAGSLTGNLEVKEANYYTPRFTVSNTGSGANTFFLYTAVSGSRIFVSDRSGKIKSYEKTAQPGNIIDLGNYFAENFCMNETDLFSASVYNSGSARSIQKYNLQSGVLQQGTPSTLEVKKMFFKNADDLILFGNDGGNGKILFYDIASNSLSEPLIFGGGIIYDACLQSNGYFLVACSGGIYQINSFSLTQSAVITGNPAHHINIEKISGNIYFSDAGQLFIYTSGYNLLSSATASDSIVAIDFLYNK